MTTRGTTIGQPQLGCPGVLLRTLALSRQLLLGRELLSQASVKPSGDPCSPTFPCCGWTKSCLGGAGFVHPQCASRCFPTFPYASFLAFQSHAPTSELLALRLPCKNSGMKVMKAMQVFRISIKPSIEVGHHSWLCARHGNLLGLGWSNKAAFRRRGNLVQAHLRGTLAIALRSPHLVIAL